MPNSVASVKIGVDSDTENVVLYYYKVKWTKAETQIEQDCICHMLNSKAYKE